MHSENLYPLSNPFSLDALLLGIAEGLQLTPTLHQAAEQHYDAISDLLERSTHPLLAPGVDIYSQGSFRIGTTLRPINRREYDLDFVCQLRFRHTTAGGAVDVLDAVEAELRDNGRYRDKIERLKRCVRICYAGEFHMDILPACPEPTRGSTAIRVPDRQLEEWLLSNPKAFAEWFEARCIEHRRQVLAKAQEPLPALQDVRTSPVLRTAVQLIKRRRDVWFASVPELAPVSVVLTTLAGHCASSRGSLAADIGGIVANINLAVRTSLSPLRVQNPTIPEELFSERWEKNPASYVAFAEWIDDFDGRWQALLGATTLDAQKEHLEKLFGEDETGAAIRKAARMVNDARERGGLGVDSRGTLTLISSPSVTPVRRNTFYGD